MARTLSEMRGYTPRRRSRRRDDLDERRRLDVVNLDGLFADAAWSNLTMEPFCLSCEAQAQNRVTMMLPAETICASCGRRIDHD